MSTVLGTSVRGLGLFIMVLGFSVTSAQGTSGTDTAESIRIEEDLEGEVWVPLVEFVLAPPRIRHDLDPELQMILASILEAPIEDPEGSDVGIGSGSDTKPESERVAQVVIDQGRVLLRPDFEEGQSTCLDSLFEDLRMTGCVVIDAPVRWDDVRIHRLTCLSHTARRSSGAYMRDNVFFYILRSQPSSDALVGRMLGRGWPQLCRDEASHIHGLLPVPVDGSG